MPSKLDPHIAMIEGWLAAQPQLTALAIVGRLSEKYPEEFGTRQHSIVQRLLRALRKKAAEKLIAQEPPCPAMTTAPQPLPSSKPWKSKGSTDRSSSDRQYRLRHHGNIRR